MGLTSDDSAGLVRIRRVNEGGPAAKAGLLANDIILSVQKYDSAKNSESKIKSLTQLIKNLIASDRLNILS